MKAAIYAHSTPTLVNICSKYYPLASAQHETSSKSLRPRYSIEGVEVVIDDILIWRASEEEHDTRLEKVLQRAQSRNLKLNKDKSQIKQKEMSYIGHTLSEQGTKPDPK